MLSLKVQLLSGQTKAFRFSDSMSVGECIASMRERTAEGEIPADAGLIQDMPTQPAMRHLRPDRTLMYYDLKSGDTLKVLKRHCPIKIKLMDDTVKTVMIDQTATAAEATEIIGEKIGLNNAEEYSLQATGEVFSHAPLDQSRSLWENGVAEHAQLVLKVEN